MLGAVVLGVAVYALSGHKGDTTQAADQTQAPRTTTITPSTTPSTTPRTPTGSHKTSTGNSGAGPSLPTPSESGGSAGTDGGGSAKAVPLVVLNDTTTSGLAHDAGQRFHDGGWTITSTGNLPSGITDIVSTCAYYDPDNPDAKSAADALRQQYPTIKRIKQRFDGLPDGPIVVVLTPDYATG